MRLGEWEKLSLEMVVGGRYFSMLWTPVVVGVVVLCRGVDGNEVDGLILL